MLVNRDPFQKKKKQRQKLKRFLDSSTKRRENKENQNRGLSDTENRPPPVWLMNKRVNSKQTPNTENVAMPTTGSASSPNMVGSEPGAEGGAGAAESKPSGTGKGSMKIKRTSSSKVLTKSKSSGSLKKKAEPKPSGKNTELTGESASGEVRQCVMIVV